MTTDEIKKFISDNRICVVTNSRCLYGTQFLASMKSYIDYLPIHNYWIIPGFEGDKLYYGYKAFLKMLYNLSAEDNFDYVIYIDDDCFISDFTALIHEFKSFMKSRCCMGGIQDGCVLCHRTHSKILVNTFLSFWNIKMIRGTNFVKIINNIADNVQPKQYYKFFKDSVDEKVLKIMYSNADESIARIKQYRDTHSTKEVPYCKVVREDPLNKIESKQEPYSTDDETKASNTEPYYALEEAMVMATNRPIYYMFACDLYDETKPEDTEEFDNSGLTSVVLTSDTNVPICYHTWFSRAYTLWPKKDVQEIHTKRINKIIDFLKIK